MAERPTHKWRARVAEEAAMIDRGDLDPDDAYAQHLWPEELITRTDAVLTDFTHALVAGFDPTSDEQITAAVRDVVIALNHVNRRNRDQGRMGYETGEREQLCDFIERTLEQAGVDVNAYAHRRGIARHEVTDDWRER